MNDSKKPISMIIAVSVSTQLTIPEGLLSFTCVILLQMDSWAVFILHFSTHL